MTDKCKFSEAWVGRCNANSGESELCVDHEHLKCASCGAQATKSCDHTGIQFICGAPLCHQCQHAPYVGAGPNWFALGGTHKTNAIAEQEWREYFEASTKP